ncbi:MAG: hypothetical protein R3C46_15975 [Hyphomonadaceae bacterium]
MKQGRSRRMLAALAASAALISVSQAASRQQTSTDLSGPWRFQSGTFDGDCKMSGGVSLRPSGKAGQYACDLIVETHCRNPDDGLYEYWRVKQTCTATQTGASVRITGKIGRVEDARWFDEPIDAENRTTYVPDNFELTLDRGGDEMNGQMVDRVRRVSARMWRESELVS